MAQQNQIGTHKTKVFTASEVTCVTYHNTRVVAFSENAIMLDTGGYFTPTTKKRMNQASNQFDLGYRVYQKNYEWFAEYNGKTYEFIGNNLGLKRN
jgi:ATP-dependent RNA circularization protein (DNA/RNA ligase family)